MEIKTKRSSYTLIPGLGIIVNSEIADEYLSLYPGEDEIDEEKLFEQLRTKVTDEEIREQICSTRNLTLNITEECNFRCKYCAYSGSYELIRTHNSKKMIFQTAKKAVDYFLDLIRIKKRKIKNNSISICFYGGEALLEFHLLVDIVKYAKEKFREKGMDNIYNLRFRLSTNGYLLNRKDILDFLVENDFYIDISLDGPENEHDKFRLTREGKETWNTIWNNINNINIKYPEFYSERVGYLVTLHPRHDFKEIDNFFIENQNYFDIQDLIVNFVNEDLLKMNIKKQWFGKGTLQSSKLIDIKASKRIENKLTLKKVNLDTKFTNMCFPGSMKIFVSSDGKFFICERIKQDIPIGDVDNGLDFDAVRKILRLWNEEIIKNRCWECPAWAFCNVCAAQSVDKDGIKIDCTYKDQIQGILSKYLAFKEEEAEKANPDFKGLTIKEYVHQL